MKHVIVKVVKHLLQLFLVSALIAAIAVTVVLQPFSAKPALAQTSTPNPIQTENSLTGDPTWNDFSAPLQPDVLSGYGSKISVNHGDSIDLFVTTTSATFTIDI